jgi:hypothetical protein
MQRCAGPQRDALPRDLQVLSSSPPPPCGAEISKAKGRSDWEKMRKRNRCTQGESLFKADSPAPIRDATGNPHRRTPDA